MDSLTKYFKTDALGAVVFVGGLHEIEADDIVLVGIRVRCMNELLF